MAMPTQLFKPGRHYEFDYFTCLMSMIDWVIAIKDLFSR